MKKIIFKSILILVLFLLSPGFVFAEEKQGITIGEPSLRLRSGPGKGYGTITNIPYLTNITIISYDSNTQDCEGHPWAKIRLSDGTEGYACSRYINETSTANINLSEAGKTMANMTDIEFDAYLNAQGFPESYKVKLKEIHKLHPSWIFIGSKSKYSWDSAILEQDEYVSYNGDGSPGRSFLNINPTKASQGQEAYLSTQPADYNYYTNKFIPHDGSYWFQANTQAVAHYMDPRTYLTEKNIFAFEDLTFDSNVQTEDAVKAVLSSDFLKQFSSYFMKAANSYNVSPVYLASLSRQEVGVGTGNICTNGQAGVLSDGVNYTGYYNFFNIGASSSADPKLKSLQKAKENGWDSPEKAIVNGAYIISKNYIQCGQHTLYYQKYNFSPKATKEMWHQYTTAIDSLSSQSNTTYNSYKSMGLIDTAFKFDIPIFNGMPEKTPLPTLGNPNNYMSEIKVNNMPLTNFDGANEKYSITISYTDKITITGTTVANTSKVNGLGTFDMTSDTQVQKVAVTSANGLVKTYEITVNRLPNPNATNNTNTGTNNDNTNTNTNTDTNNNTNNNNTNTDNNNNNTNDNTNTTPQPAPTKIEINDVINASSYKINSEYLSNITFGSGVSTLITNLKKYSEAVSITVKNSDNSAKTSGTIGTGDKVTISTGTEEKTYIIVLYGDTNGDGNISAIDLLNVQKLVINKSNLNGAYYKAADTNKDGKISAIDLLNVQKHILGKLIISQN